MARMSSHHLGSQGGGWEPQRKFDFEFQGYGIPGADLIKLGVKTINPGGQVNEAIDLPYLNDVVKVAGQGKANDAEVVCRDFVDQAVYKSLMDWRKLVQDPETGNIGLASSYKKNADIVLIGPDGSTERKLQLKGCWPKSVIGEQLDYTAGTNEYTVTVTLAVDYVVPAL